MCKAKCPGYSENCPTQPRLASAIVPKAGVDKSCRPNKAFGTFYALRALRCGASVADAGR